ncbi:unnamed protein product, partial [Gulo gulo]
GLGQPRRRPAFAAAGKTLQTLDSRRRRGGAAGGGCSQRAGPRRSRPITSTRHRGSRDTSKGSDLKLHPPPSSTGVSSVEASASQRTPNLALPAPGLDSPASPPSSVAAWRRLLAPLALVVPRPEARWPHRSSG